VCAPRTKVTTPLQAANGPEMMRMRRTGPMACVLRDSGDMSQRSVEIVIGRLASDESLRTRFLADPAGTLRSLREAGLDLNLLEFEALLETPSESWKVMASRVHPRLQKIALGVNRREA